jgi:hypothetical protein
MQDHHASAPLEADHCFDHRHMSGLDFAIYILCSRLAHKTGIVYFDGRAIARSFEMMSKTTVYSHIKRLIAKGFLKVVQQPGYRKNGTYSPYYFTVLSHDEWVKEHPGQCPVPVEAQPVPVAGLVSSPVRPESQPVPVEAQPVRPESQPVPVAGHKLIESNLINSNLIFEVDTASPVPLRGQVDGFINKHLSKTERKRGNARASVAPPVPLEGQVVSITPPTPEQIELASAINDRMGNKIASQTDPWKLSIRRLTGRGIGEETILKVFDHYLAGRGKDHVRREQAYGFEQSFDQSLKELNSQTEVAA